MMELVALCTVLVASMFADASQYYISSNRTTSENASTLCTLASPCIDFSKVPPTVDVEQDGLNTAGPLWVAYTQSFGAFAYRGCYNEDGLETGDVDSAPENCNSYCKTKYIGVTQSKCRCITSTQLITGITSCNSAQKDSHPLIIGSGNIYTVYEKVGYPLADNEEKATITDYCLAFKPSVRKFAWYNCGDNFLVICRKANQSYVYGNNSYMDWKQSVEMCTQYGDWPADLSTDLSSVPSRGSQLWTGIIRYDTIFGSANGSANTIRFNHGHISRKANDKFELSFDPINHTIASICVNGSAGTEVCSPRSPLPTYPPDHTTEYTTKRQKPDAEGTQGTAYSNTQTTNSAVRQADKQSTSDAVYAVIPVIVVVITVCAAIFIWWRRRSLSKMKDNPLQTNPSVKNLPVKSSPQTQNTDDHGYLILEPASEYSTIRNSAFGTRHEEEYDTTHQRETTKNTSDNVYNHLEKDPEETYDHTGAVFAKEDDDTYNHAIPSSKEEVYDKINGQDENVRDTIDHEGTYSHIKTPQHKTSVNDINNDIDDTYNHVQR